MKNLFRLFSVIFSLFAIVSCGGEESSVSDGTDSAEQNVDVSIRAITPEFAEQIGAIYFSITDRYGNEIFHQSIRKEDLTNQTELKGIKDVTNATLSVSVFARDSEGNNEQSPRWMGKVRGLNFEKGTTTEVDVMLYSSDVSNVESTMTQSLSTPRFGHTATLLADGRVLIAGGFTSCGSNGKCQTTDSVEIIDVESGEIQPLTNMTESRAMHTAVALEDGSVIFIGGVKGLNSYLQTADEIFDNFPALPYSFSQSSAITTIEHYMPPYPKSNMVKNNLGVPVSNIARTLTTPSPIPFATFQSVLAEKISSSETVVFLVGGLDSEGKPSGKSYKFSLILNDSGEVSVSNVTELSESSEPMLLPALAAKKDSSGQILGVLALGGRPNDSEYSASFISESGSEDKGKDAGYNLLFTNHIALNNALYVFSGLKNEEGSTKEVNKIFKWNLDDDSLTVSKDLIQPGDKAITFAEVVYDEKNGRFIAIGGTNASDYYQAVNASTLEWYQKSPSHKMSDSRIMSKAVIIPVEKSSTENPLIFITGGINSLDGTGSGSANGKVKVNNL
ncbi:hypothetical protein J6Z19_06715 [bacterium]|nr:hypothetical protein [bacterium]